MKRLIWVAAAAAVTLAAGAPAARADVTPEFFTLPAELKGAGTGLDAAPDGTVYFGASGINADQPPVGRIDPAAAAPGTSNGITAIPTGDNPATCCFAAIRDVSWSAKDNGLYFTRSDGMVGLYKGGAVNSLILNGNIAAYGIAAAPDGGAWFSETGDGPGVPAGQDRLGNRIAFVSSALGLTEAKSFAQQTAIFDDKRFNAQPYGITVGPDGRPWVAEYNAGLPGYRIATWTGGAYTEYFPPCAAGAYCSGQFNGTALSDVAVAADGSVWYTNELKHTIGKLVPGGEVSEFKLADMDPTLAAGVPRTIKTAVDGALWIAVSGGYSAPGANAVVRINPADLTKTVYKIGAAMTPLEAAPDAKGNVWVVGTPPTAAGSSIARLSGVVGVPATAPPVTSGGTPVITPITQPVITGTKLTPAVTTTAKVNDPTVKGDSINANQICVGPPADKCSLVYLIQTHEYVAGFPGVKGSAAKVKTFTIGKKTVTLKGGQKAKVTVKLNSLGKKLYKKKKHFKATLTVTQTVKGVKKPKTILKKNVTFKR